MTPGEVALVLHTHIPYVKNHGVWPVGEEWLFQAWGESWLPLTNTLLRLAEDGHRDVLTLGVSPLVAEQVDDPRLRRDLGTWLAAQMWQSEEQRTAYRGPDRHAIRDLAGFHWRRFADLLDVHEALGAAGGILAVWADLASQGVIEILGGPATHPYLPLMADPRLVDAQLATGLATHRRWTGQDPAGMWAPECGYRPAGQVADPTAEPLFVDAHGTPTLPRSGPELPGLEEHYARHGVTHIVVDAPTLMREKRDWTVRPDHVDDVVYDGVLIGESDVVAFARDLSVAYHVWSPTSGYPGDPWYRDFHADAGFGTHRSWRVTDKAVERKAPYEPEQADKRASVHAEHLHGVLRDTLDPRPGAVVVAAYDTELFGHWWLEGTWWLERLLRRVREDPRLMTTTLRTRLHRRPPTRRLELPESSWGYAKGHASWVTPESRPMWRLLRSAESRFLSTASAGDETLRQAARELACAQASDWPFMVGRGDCPGYARDRLRGHVVRLERLCEAAGTPEAAAVAAESATLVDVPRDPSPFTG